MAVENYGKFKEGQKRRLKKRIIGAIAAVLIAAAGIGIIGTLASNSDEYKERVSILEENHMLKEENEQLKETIAALEAQIGEKDEQIAALTVPIPADVSVQSEAPADTAKDPTSPRN